MKNALLLILLLGAISTAHGQTLRARLLNPHVYRTWVDIRAVKIAQVKRINPNTGEKEKGLWVTPKDTVLIQVPSAGTEPPYLDYKVVSEDENGYTIIRVLPNVTLGSTVVSIPGKAPKTVSSVSRTPPGPDGKVHQDVYDPSNGYNYLYSVKKDAFPALSKAYMGGKFYGQPIVYPFKYRPSQANLGGRLYADFTISYCFGYRFRLAQDPLKETFLTVVPFGFGVGAAQHIRRLPDSKLSEEKDAAAATYWQGGLFVTIQKVGIGVFTGLDAMVGHKNDWIYQSKPWLSFGVGYKFKED